MPSFDDDDLKRLRGEVETTCEHVRPWITTSELKALIARLEAAEAYIASMPEDVTDANCRLHKEWRKAAGKA